MCVNNRATSYATLFLLESVAGVICEKMVEYILISISNCRKCSEECEMVSCKHQLEQEQCGTYSSHMMYCLIFMQELLGSAVTALLESTAAFDWLW